MSPVSIQPPAAAQDQTSTVIIISVFVAIVAVISVVLRFYTRIFTRTGLGPDDWLILSAVLTTMLTGSLLFWANRDPSSDLWISEEPGPDYLVSTPDGIVYMKFAFITSSLYFTVAGTTKLGILLMYHRIFAVSTAFRYQLFVVSGLAVGWWVGCTVAILMECLPLEWNWINALADSRHCFNHNIFWMATGICEIILDVLILIMPISVVVRMRLSRAQKLTVSGIFLLGGLVVVTGIVRVAFSYVPDSRVPSFSNTEVWTLVHIGIAIICASLPIFNPLVKRISGSPFMIKISSILSLLKRNREGFQSSTEQLAKTYSEENRRGHNGSYGNEDDSQRAFSYLNIISAETETDDSHFELPEATRLGRICAGSKRQGQPRSKRHKEEHMELSLQLPQIDIAERI